MCQAADRDGGYAGGDTVLGKVKGKGGCKVRCAVNSRYAGLFASGDEVWMFGRMLYGE